MRLVRFLGASAPPEALLAALDACDKAGQGTVALALLEAAARS